jgi:hypothetical protein
MSAAERAQPQGIRAYHGSPHDFDRFSLDKIGTGEGAQAYGHGLYFADSEDVAKSYREPVSGGWGGERLTVNGVSEDDLPLHVKQAVRSVASVAGDGPLDPSAIEKALQQVKDTVARYEASKDGSVRKYNLPQAQETLRGLEELKGAEIGRKGVGHMYEVNIKANPEDFLDWDKPITEQPRIAEIAQRLAPDVPLDARQLAAHTIYAPEFRNALTDAGIPGIRYLDAMSRDGGAGTSNYVVFDDQLIDILRKYANAPTGAALPVGMEAGDNQLTTEQIRKMLKGEK